MTVSINSFLKDLASTYYLKNSSDEVTKINNSIDSLLKNLDKSLWNKIKRHFVFWSYDRDTILPRSIDKNSDIDIMIVFNHTDYERTPETYRKRLYNFANEYYNERYNSVVLRSLPTVTIRLNNINYDLVPAKEITIWSVKNLYIPNSDNAWRETDPYDVRESLRLANVKYDYVVKPIIRLMKARNATHNYPFDSYALELMISKMSFYKDNHETGFFRACEHLDVNSNDTFNTINKVESLLYNIGKVKECLKNNDLTKAKERLNRVLPF